MAFLGSIFRWKIAQAAEIRWWRLYLREKNPTTYLPKKRAYWLSFLVELGVSVPAGSTVLDAGCGPSGIFMALSDCKVVACDPLLDQYQSKLHGHFNAAWYPNTEFVHAGLEALPSKKYDFIFCLNVINHIADLEAGLDALAQLTQPGTTLVLSVDVHNSSWLKRIFRLFPGDILHPQQHDLADYESMLQSRGLTMLTPPKLLRKENIFSFYGLVLVKA
jgi:2-polyprenyl-3-methyl-5-hydroxy-6-metoxy-1,4-benzoquinol methylase